MILPTMICLLINFSITSDSLPLCKGNIRMKIQAIVSAHPPLPLKQPTFTIIPVGLCLRFTQLLVLLTLCPPFPQPLIKFSSISSSLRWTSPLNRTKSTIPEERNMADAKCKRPIESNVERRAVTRFKPFQSPSVQEYMSFRDAYLSVLHFSDTLTMWY